MPDEFMNIVVVGHVDHGKSTIIGRLLADTNSLPEGKLSQVKAYCENNSKPFEYAFLLDALKDEQTQGITIDIARCFFKTKKRKYIILDAPGHIEFLKNMITGAANAEAALLVIDAKEGVQENSRRHGYMLSMLGIKQIAVVINKMDLIDYQQEKFNKIKNEYEKFLNQLGLKAKFFVPASGMQGDNVAVSSVKLPWYAGNTVLDIIDSFAKSESLVNHPFRMPVQDIYKFTRFGDDRRVVVGRLESGKIQVNDRLVFYPSGKVSEVESIQSFNTKEKERVSAGYSTGFTLKQQIYIKRGEIVVNEKEHPPMVSSKLQVSVFWLGHEPFNCQKEYFIKIGTAKVHMKVEKILTVMDSVSLKVSKDRNVVNRHEIAECVFQLSSPIAFDLAQENPITSRFVIVDNYDIAGGGIIQAGILDKNSDVQKQIQHRNLHWISSEISREEREEQYRQKPSVIVVTGKQNSGRKKFAKQLERRLFLEGRKVYYLGIGNVVHGIDADIVGHSSCISAEHLRRFAEVLNILLDAGEIVIVTAIAMSQNDVNLIKESTSCDDVFVVWMGDKKASNIPVDINVEREKDLSHKIDSLCSLLISNNIVY